MKKTFPFLLLCSACFLFNKENEQNTDLTLSLHSAGVTSINLNVSPEDSLSFFTFELSRNDSVVKTLSIQSNTLIKDTGLNPNTAYTYKGYWMNGTKRVGESNTLNVTTMDTTSHNFTWEIDTLGEYGSYLNDVWIVDENDIWVVGALSIDDSTLNYEGHLNYNAAHWDGNEWEFRKVMQPGGYVIPVSCIYYFDENDIWFGQGGLPIQWNGDEYYMFMPSNGEHPGQPTINAIWGTSSSNMYFVGRRGSIVHYDGTEFVQMESGTNVNLKNIHGSGDGEFVFATGFTISGENAGQTVALELIDNEWQTLYSYHTTLPNNESTGGVYACYVYGDTVYFNRTGGFWKFNYLTRESTIIPPENTGGLSGFGFQKIIVANTNDIHFIANGFSYLHFNGGSWYVDHSVNTYFLSECVSNNFDYEANSITMVGYITLGKGIVVLGRHK